MQERDQAFALMLKCMYSYAADKGLVGHEDVTRLVQHVVGTPASVLL